MNECCRIGGLSPQPPEYQPVCSLVCFFKNFFSVFQRVFFLDFGANVGCIYVENSIDSMPDIIRERDVITHM